MARDKNKVRIPQKVLRVGDKVDFSFAAVDHGTDDSGPFVIVDVGQPIQAERVVSISGVDVVTEPWIEPGSVSEGDEQQDATPAVEAAKPTDKEKLDKVEKKTKALKFKELLPPIMVTEVLNVRLTDDERALAAKAAANLLGQLEDAENSFKALKAQRTAEIKELKEQISRAKAAHNTGLEYRSVFCEQKFDQESGMTWFVYQGTEYGRRPMNEREQRETRSKGLFGDAPMLPNKVDPSQLPSPKEMGGDTLAKKASKGGSVLQPPAGRMKRQPKEDVIPNGQSKDADIRQVMNEETSRKGGKHDHISN